MTVPPRLPSLPGMGQMIVPSLGEEPTMVAPPLEELVRRVVAGDADAWQAFWQGVEPRLYALLRRPRFLGRLSQSEDDCRNIVVDVMHALRDREHARLRRFLEARAANPRLPFFAWLVVIAKRLAIDYQRRHEEYEDRRGSGGGGAWRVITELPPASQLDGGRPPVTDLAAAAELRELAREELPAEQARAIELWSEGRSFEEIAAALAAGDARDAERRVRAGLERLRRRVRTEGLS